MTILVGRETQLTDALAFLRSARGVVLAGTAGVGKTALAGAITERLSATARGGQQPASTLWIRATEAGQQIAFGALGPLLPPDLATVHPALVPVLVAERLRERGGGRSPVLVVDDAQLLDESSAATVLALVSGSNVPLLATVRTGTAVSDAVTALWKDGLVERIDLTPLDRAETRALLEQRLGGEVASATSELLWARSQGNALYLSELVRFGTETGRLLQQSGVWWWHGSAAVPPRLGELLQRRLDELSPRAREALDLLAFGAPLPYDTLAALVPDEAILELDERAVVGSDERDGVVLLRFTHPLLHSVAERRLTPARRRSLAGRLRLAPAENVDVVRRAAWEEAAADAPNVDILLAAADTLMLSDPHAAARFAERALRHDPSTRPVIALSAAQAEAGDAAAARATLTLAAGRIHTDQDWLLSGLEDVSLALWSERCPAAAFAAIQRLRASARPGYDDELDSVQALVTLFTGQPAAALAQAESVLDRSPSANVRVRALTTRVGALTLTERSGEVLATVDQLLALLATTRVAATRYGLAHALVALAQLFHGQGLDLPAMAGASGRWPTPPSAASSPSAPAAWPLLAGVRNQQAGDWPAAAVSLREAFVQQTSGEGLFRSEAAACLIVVLAEDGQVAEASRLLAETPPDAVALIPGLRGWAEAAVRGAGRPHAEAGAFAVRSAQEAAAVGASPTGLWYLSDAARFGSVRLAVEALPALGDDWVTPRAQARVMGIRARAGGRPGPLVEAAERHVAVGLFGHAGELASLASARASGSADVRRRATRVLRAVVERLGERGPTGVPGLTGRESEIARLAASGLTDREIADTLVVSVRTVESHLAAAYRKLGIDSRRALSDALPG